MGLVSNGNQAWTCDICGKHFFAGRDVNSIRREGKTWCLKCVLAADRIQAQKKKAEEAEKEQERIRRISEALDTAPIPCGEESPLLLSAGLLTLDNGTGEDGTLWASIRGGKSEWHRTLCTGSEFSGYHDEENLYVSTCDVSKPEDWDDENWFAEEAWLRKTAVRPSGLQEPDLYALYYEGHGIAATSRWKERFWMTDSFDGSLAIWLRRCKGYWRLLRVSLPGKIFPFEFDFREESLPELYSRYADRCFLFQDFPLTKEETGWLAAVLQGTERGWSLQSFKPGPGSFGLVRKKPDAPAEESNLPEQILGSLLRIRSLHPEDFWAAKIAEMKQRDGLFRF